MWCVWLILHTPNKLLRATFLVYSVHQQPFDGNKKWQLSPNPTPGHCNNVLFQTEYDQFASASFSLQQIFCPITTLLYQPRMTKSDIPLISYRSSAFLPGREKPPHAVRSTWGGFSYDLFCHLVSHRFSLKAPVKVAFSLVIFMFSSDWNFRKRRYVNDITAFFNRKESWNWQFCSIQKPLSCMKAANTSCVWNGIPCPSSF